jgi:hypothetical protein
MARKGVFAEARLYVTTGSIALLLSVWAALAAGDAIKQSKAAQSQTVSGTVAQQHRQAAPAPDTRTKGS